MTTTDAPEPAMTLHRSDFEDGGRFEDHIIMNLRSEDVDMVIVTTESTGTSAMNPTCVKVEDNLFVVFYDKRFVDSMEEIVIDALRDYRDDVPEPIQFIGALTRNAVRAFTQWRTSTGRD